MTTDYPVHVEVESPPRFERSGVILRIVLAIVLGWVGITAGWLACVVFAVLPLIAAIAVSSRGRDYYRDELGPQVWRAMTWLIQFSAYMTMLVDVFPTSMAHPVRLELRYTATPTVGSTLLRLLTSLPSALVLSVLYFVSGFVVLIAMIFAVISADVPRPLLAFERGVLRWQVRLVAYHASLVDEYPPFAFDTDTNDGHNAPLSTAGAS